MGRKLVAITFVSAVLLAGIGGGSLLYKAFVPREHSNTHQDVVPFQVPVSDAVDAPKLAVQSAGDHLDVRASIGNKQRWRVVGDELVLVAVSKDGELLDWSYSNPFTKGPQPNPTPTPSPGPSPTPTPTPIPTKQSLWVTVVHESADRTPAFVDALLSPDADAAVKAGGHHFRLVDKDVQDENGTTPSYLVGYVTRAKAKGLPYVFFTNSQGQVQWEGPVTTKADFIAKLKTYGG